MAETVPLTELRALDDGIVALRADVAVLVTPANQWAYAAEVAVPLPDIETEAQMIKVKVSVPSGVLGMGWLQHDETAWVTRTSVSSPTAKESELIIPAGTRGGKLVFDNWSEGDKPAIGIVESISVIKMSGLRSHADDHFQAALAEEQEGNREQAIAEYSAALSSDPSHVEAIAGLGRLRFVDPEQPFMSEMKRRVPVVDVCEVYLQVRNPCNFRCFYCICAGNNNTPVQRFDFDGIGRAFGQIKAKLILTSFECGGGEPTVHPQFPELLRICTDHGAVSFPSNNSQNPERWLPKGVGRRLVFRSAFHPESEPHIDRYIRYARYLMDEGVEFSSLFISHPSRMDRIPEFRETFAKHGVPFTPVAFMGDYNGNHYPYAYDDDEKEMLGLNQEVRYWAHKVEPHTTRIRNFRGIPCIAGHRHIYMANDGSFRRCIFDQERVLDKPLDTHEPCGVKTCGCGLFLDKLNATEIPELWNYYGGKVGLEPFPLDWVEPLAHEFVEP